MDAAEDDALEPQGQEGEEGEEFLPRIGAMSLDERERAETIRSAIQYILDPHIPKGYREQFEKYEMLISRSLALSNLRSWEDIYRYVKYFDVIILYLKLCQPELAIKRMCRMIMELQLTRSVGGFERLAMITTRHETGAGKKEEKKGGWWIFR